MSRLRKMIQSIPSRVRDDGPTWCALLVVAVVYAVTHKLDRDHPHVIGEGWWRWWDQGHYLTAAHAWAGGDLDASKHWYFPGYALIGALFVWLKPAQPFFWPNLVLLLVAGWQFVRLGERLGPDTRHIRIMSASVFALTLAGSPWLMKSFVVPWTTTPTAPLTYGSFLLAFRLADRPTAKTAAMLGATTVAVVLFRPTEAMLLTAVIAVWAVGTLITTHVAWRDTLVVAFSGVAGALLPVAVLGALHLVIYGPQLSGYMLQSRLVGFEWSLTTLRWVTLWIAPQPLFTDGVTYGMAGAFPWVVSGFAGLVATLLSTREVVLARNALVAVTIVAQIVVYLAYRDLHPQGLFRYNNYHYFKWTLPFLGLYSVFLFSLVRTHLRRRTIWAVAAVATVILFCWRAEWLPSAETDASITGPRDLTLDHGFASPRHGVRVVADGTFNARFMDEHVMQVGSTTYRNHTDFKVFPTPDGVLVTMLRPAQPGAAVITFRSGVTLNESIRPELGRQSIVFGLPSLLGQATERPRAWLKRILK